LSPVESESKKIDWTRVGRVYSNDTTVEEVASKEMSRLKRSFEHKLTAQDEQIVKA
jgi:hypothetical protein